MIIVFFFSSRRRHTRCSRDWSSDVCSSDLTSNGREAVERAVSLKADVVVLDVGMPELNGLEATRRIVKASPRTEVLILTVYETEEAIRQVLPAGPRGDVLKSDAGRLLLSATA